MGCSHLLLLEGTRLEFRTFLSYTQKTLPYKDLKCFLFQCRHMQPVFFPAINLPGTQVISVQVPPSKDSPHFPKLSIKSRIHLERSPLCCSELNFLYWPCFNFLKNSICYLKNLYASHHPAPDFYMFASWFS